MDFLDPAKHHRHMIQLAIGYVLMTLAVLLAAVILLYLAKGFVVGKDGEIIQNGLVFVSSNPRGASIYLNGGLEKNATNTRLTVPAGQYTLKLQRDGYRDWQRVINVEGGSVGHFDYPFLFPANLVTANMASYAAAPPVVTQTPDRRWLLVQKPGAQMQFEVYDLKDIEAKPLEVVMPDSVITGTPEELTRGWKIVEWSTDNRHLLFKHTYGSSYEYVILDRTNPSESVNVSRLIDHGTGQLSLRDKKYDQYFIFDSAKRLLQVASLKDNTPKQLIDHVLAFHPYRGDTVLYVTDTGATDETVNVNIKVGDTVNTVRTLPIDKTYLLDLAQYSGDLYVAVGSKSENKVYVYKDPVNQIRSGAYHLAIPSDVLKVYQPVRVSFSANARFVMAENKAHFSVYDAETNSGYTYSIKDTPLDAPQTYATWMDGHRLTYVSRGSLVVFDYDMMNLQKLMPAAPQNPPFFTPSYDYVYAFTSVKGQSVLTSTALRTADDL